MKHTPGKWMATNDGTEVFTDFKSDSIRTSGYGCDNHFIADLNDGEYHEYHNRDEQKANAKLIAKAPEMAGLLQKIIETDDCTLGDCSLPRS